MNVVLLNHTPEPIKTIALAARLCYSKKDISTLAEDLTEGEMMSLIIRLLESRHLSPFEHVTFTFGIEGVSRALSHQLVRHRHQNLSQKSQRYVKENQFEFIIAEAFKEKGLADKFSERMGIIQSWYDEAIKMGIKAEDARMYLPNACETKLIVTKNARDLLHYFEERCCYRAQYEHRLLADEMLRLVTMVAPLLFSKAGRTCLHGDCKEGKYGCGLFK